MLKFKARIVGALLLASTSFAPARADVQVAAKDVADVEFTIARNGEGATTFELSDCDLEVKGDRGSTVTFDSRNGVTTIKGGATISASQEGKQVFFMSVKNALITMKRNTGG